MFLKEASQLGYTVILCFVRLTNSAQSLERVAMRVSQGGHDVPDQKLDERFPRSLANLQRAIDELPHVMVFDNSDLNHPYQLVAVYDHGQLVEGSA
jgi:predicted ABC-type ATPase